MRSAKQFSPQFSYKNVEYDFNIFIVIKIFFQKENLCCLTYQVETWLPWPLRSFGTSGFLWQYDLSVQLWPTWPCRIFCVYVTNICSKTCLCTWVIVPIFWSSTFTCPIFAIEEKEFAFSWRFWLGLSHLHHRKWNVKKI